MKQALATYADLLRAGPHGLLSRSELQQVEAHIEDSLTGAAVMRELGVTSFTDVGSGGGLPGIPLALALPEATAHLVESQAWKARFLEDSCASLGLKSRVRVWPHRVEALLDFVPRESLDCAVSRALARPIISAEYLAPLVRPGGHLVLWSTSQLVGREPPGLDEAAAELGLGQHVLRPTPTTLRDDGVLVIWEKVAPTNPRFPRRIGVATKRPLLR